MNKLEWQRKILEGQLDERRKGKDVKAREEERVGRREGRREGRRGRTSSVRRLVFIPRSKLKAEEFDRILQVTPFAVRSEAHVEVERCESWILWLKFRMLCSEFDRCVQRLNVCCGRFESVGQG